MPRKRGPKSKVHKLDPGIKAELDRLIFDEGRTLDDVVAYLQALRLDDMPSRSSIARYSADVAEIRADMDRLRSATGQLVKEFGDQDNDAVRFLIQIAQSIAYKLMAGKSGVDQALDVEEFMQLMKGLKDLTGARKTTFDAEEKILARVGRALDKAEKAMATASAAGKPIDAMAALRKIREDVYGISA